MNGIARLVVNVPSSRRFQRSGSHIVRKPMTISAATTTAMASNTWVIPPVGSGRAGTNMRKRIVVAKVFSANTTSSDPSVFEPSLSSQASSSSAKVWSVVMLGNAR